MSAMDTEARTILRNAVGAMNSLIVHLNAHPETFPAATRGRMVEADYLLNSAADDVSDFVGNFPAPDPDDLIIEDDGGVWVLYFTDHGTISAAEDELRSTTYWVDEPSEVGSALIYGALEADRRKAVKNHLAAIQAF